MVKVLLVGNGAREHVLAETLVRSPQEVEVYAFMKSKNPGIIDMAAKFEIGDITDPEAVAKFAVDNQVDFAVIGPEAPLSKGVVDKLEEVGVKSVGPKKTLARLETSSSP